MTTQDQPTTKTPSSRRYQIFWNADGEHVSKLAYTDEQIKDIDEIVYAVVRGVLDEKRFDITVTDEPYSATEDRALSCLSL